MKLYLSLLAVSSVLFTAAALPSRGKSISLSYCCR
jgi:hypothetical protein